MKDELERLKEYAEKVLKQMWGIYNDYGSLSYDGKYYDKYHDTMLTQCQGADMDYNESLYYILEEWDKSVCISSFESTIKRYEKCLKGLEAMKDVHVAMKDADSRKAEIVDNLMYG